MSRASHPVLIIVGSAGALPVLTRVLMDLPERASIPIVVVIHRGAHRSYDSYMVKHLIQQTDRAVSEVEDLSEHIPGRVLVAPGGYHTLVGRHGASLTVAATSESSVPSIDAALESAALSLGPSAIVVALSCANSDGVAGTRRVLNEGGSVIALDPQEAEYRILVSALANLPGTRIAGTHQLVDAISQAIAEHAKGG